MEWAVARMSTIIPLVVNGGHPRFLGRDRGYKHPIDRERARRRIGSADVRRRRQADGRRIGLADCA